MLDQPMRALLPRLSAARERQPRAPDKFFERRSETHVAEFFRPLSGFLARSFALLDEFPKLACFVQLLILTDG
jgi:hypothetical protein